MSENYGATPPGGTVDTAKQEASDLAATAKTEATDVVDSGDAAPENADRDP